jgi:hypothetical protein
MAVFAEPISFIMAALPGLSGIALLAETDLAMFSLVQAIIFAEAALPVSVAAIVIAMNNDFIVSSLRSLLLRHDKKSGKKRKVPQNYAAIYACGRGIASG